MRQRSSLPYVTDGSDAEERNAEDRRKTALLLLTEATSAVDLVTLAAELELDDELDELAGTSPERQRLLQAARARAQLPRLEPD